MNKIIIGSITNYNPDDIKPWVISVKNNVPDAIVYMVTLNVPNETIEFLNQNDISVVTLSKQTPASYHSPNICVERFWYYSILAKKFNSDDIVLATDVKDVVFQSDPFPILVKMSEYGSIFLSSEGITYENETWGKNNLKLSFGQNKYEELADKIIANAGVLAGTAEYLGILSEMIHRYSLSTGLHYVEGGGGPDQAALNVLMNNPLIQPYCIFSQSLACQCGTVNNPVYEDKIIHLGGFMNDDGLIVSATGKVFPIVHQYDRVKDWNSKIREMYS